MEKHLLSKSTFLRGFQCAKSLYLYKNFIQLRDRVSLEQTAIFNRGNSVGILAQKLFPGGVDATPAKRSNNGEGVKRTRELISNGVEIIYEAAFQHEQVLAILDILVKRDDKWYAYEVKSSTKISNTYLLDASLQYWVITNYGLPLADIALITINNQYIRIGELDLQQLFAIKSVKQDVLKNQTLVEENIFKSKLVIANAEQPNIPIGEQCFSPYTCDFMGYCWKNVPPDSVFQITGIPKAEQFALYNAGYKTIKEIPASNNLNANVNTHITSVKNDEEKIDKAAINEFLNKVKYPVFFMDFETFMPAVPIYNKTKPYQHIPFQYSLHYKKSKDAILEHYSFLAEQGMDPRKSFVESLLKSTETEGTILVYDTLMEKNILNGLKKDFPEYISSIDIRINRIVDLMLPFQNKSYYHPAMKNSFSIKNLWHRPLSAQTTSISLFRSGSLDLAFSVERIQLLPDTFTHTWSKSSMFSFTRRTCQF